MRHRSALSLVEVLAASAVLVLGLGATFSAMGSADHTRRRTEDRNQALAEIQSQVEKLQAMDTQAIQQQFLTSNQFPFSVNGLTPPEGLGRTTVGVIERLAPTTTTYGCVVLRLRCDWQAMGGADSVQLIYFWTRRAYEG